MQKLELLLWIIWGPKLTKVRTFWKVSSCYLSLEKIT